MTARDDIAAHFTSDTLADSLLDAYRAEVLREAADKLDQRASTPPSEAPYTDAYTAFMQFGTMPCLRGLRAELRIEGHPPIVGRYAGAGTRKHPNHEDVLLVEPMLVFEYAEPTTGGAA